MIVPELAPDTEPVKPPGLEVAVYVVIVAPPLEAGAVKATVAVVDPVAVAVPTVGAPGGDTGVTEDEAFDTAPVPATLEALTRNVYAVPFVKPVTVALADVDVPSRNVVHVVPSVEDSTT